MTYRDRRLNVTFTKREDRELHLPISARSMSRKERAVYENAIQSQTEANS